MSVIVIIIIIVVVDVVVAIIIVVVVVVDDDDDDIIEHQTSCRVASSRQQVWTSLLGLSLLSHPHSLLRKLPLVFGFPL